MASIKTHIIPKSSETKKTLEEYLQREERALHKHQFINGKIIRMAGGKSNHNLIPTNLTYLLKKLTQKSDLKYFIYNSDQKIYIESVNVALYPDALVVCEKPLFWNGREDLIVNPLLIVEVLSPATHRYDRGDKFTLYKECPSLKEYVLVEQHQPKVESWYRLQQHTWENTRQEGAENSIALRSLGIELVLDEIFAQIEF